MSWDTERFYLGESHLWIWYRQTSPEYLAKLARELVPPLSPERKAELDAKFAGCWAASPDALAYAKRKARIK